MLAFRTFGLAVIIVHYFIAAAGASTGVMVPLGVLLLLAGLHSAHREGLKIRASSKDDEGLVEVPPLRVIRGMGAMSVGPFYLLLTGLLLAGQATREAGWLTDGDGATCGHESGHAAMAKPAVLAKGGTTCGGGAGGCGSGKGGCGSGGGCGSSCGSGCGGAKKAPTAATPAVKMASTPGKASAPQIVTGRSVPRVVEPGRRPLTPAVAPAPLFTPPPAPGPALVPAREGTGP